MPSYYPIQTGFSNGEISPRLRGRVDDRNYTESLQFCSNFHPTPQGSLRRREGTRHVGEAQSASSRLFGFAIPDEQDAIIELGESKIRLWGRTGRIRETARQLYRNRTFLAGFQDWEVTNPNDRITALPGTGVEVDVEKNESARLAQSIDSTGISTSQTLKFTALMLSPNDEADRGISIEVVTVASDGSGGTFRSEYLLTGDQVPDQNRTVDVEIPFTMLSDRLNDVRIQFQQLTQDPGDMHPEVRQHYVVQNLRIVYELPTPADYEWDSPYTANQLNFLQRAHDAANQISVFASPEVQPYALSRTELDGHAIFDWSAPLFQSPPNEWGGANWPSAVEFFQGRLIFAGTDNEPGTIWGSRVGAVYDFSPNQEGAEPTPADSYQFDLAANGAIQWLRGTKVLLIGTESSIWAGIGSNGILSNSNFNFEKQSELGNTHRVSPTIVSDQVLSVSNDFTAIRATNFDGITTDTYASTEPTLSAEHFFSFGGIDEIAYVREPFYQLFVNTTTGLRVCMHDRVTQLNGWWRWDTSGFVRAIASARTFFNDKAELWMVVERNGKFFIENHVPILGNVNYLDGQITKRSAAQTGPEFDTAHSNAHDTRNIARQSIDGLDVYEGLTLQCIVRQNFTTSLHRDVTVRNGRVILDQWVEANADVTVGFGYDCRAETLPLEGGNRAGTAQGSLRHFNRIFARLINNSAIPKINGWRPVIRGAVALNGITANIRSSDDVQVRDRGTFKQGVITIEQDINLPCEFSALFGKASSEVT